MNADVPGVSRDEAQAEREAKRVKHGAGCCLGLACRSGLGDLTLDASLSIEFDMVVTRRASVWRGHSESAQAEREAQQVKQWWLMC